MAPSEEAPSSLIVASAPAPLSLPRGQVSKTSFDDSNITDVFGDEGELDQCDVLYHHDDDIIFTDIIFDASQPFTYDLELARHEVHPHTFHVLGTIRNRRNDSNVVGHVKALLINRKGQSRCMPDDTFAKWREIERVSMTLMRLCQEDEGLRLAVGDICDALGMVRHNVVRGLDSGSGEVEAASRGGMLYIELFHMEDMSTEENGEENIGVAVRCLREMLEWVNKVAVASTLSSDTPCPCWTLAVLFSPSDSDRTGEAGGLEECWLGFQRVFVGSCALYTTPQHVQIAWAAAIEKNGEEVSETRQSVLEEDGEMQEEGNSLLQHEAGMKGEESKEQEKEQNVKLFLLKAEDLEQEPQEMKGSALEEDVGDNEREMMPCKLEEEDQEDTKISVLDEEQMEAEAEAEKEGQHTEEEVEVDTSAGTSRVDVEEQLSRMEKMIQFAEERSRDSKARNLANRGKEEGLVRSQLGSDEGMRASVASRLQRWR